MLERAPGSASDADTVTGASDDDGGASTSARQHTVLVFADDVARRDHLVAIIEQASWLPLIATDRDEAVRIVRSAPPDLFVMLLDGTDGDELDLLDDVRNTIDGELVPIVCVLEQRHRALTIDAFGRRADDVVWGRPDAAELIARLRARIERRPVPITELIEDPVTGALTPRAFASQLSKEAERVARGGEPGAIAFLALDELPGITARRGSRARDELLAQVVRLIEVDGRQLDFVGSRRGVLALLLPGTPSKGAQARLDRLARKIYDHRFTLDGDSVALTPIIGFTESTRDGKPAELEDRAWDAMAFQAAHLDLHPTRWVEAMSTRSAKPTTRWRRAFERVRTPTQVIGQQLFAMVTPLLVYALLDRLGVDITGVMYLIIVIALAGTAAGIWIESKAALRPTVPPEPRHGPLPPATAIIAAYLPNEAETVIETIDAFLALDYPDLEIMLAYNTPQTLPVEAELRRIADRDPRFRPLRVEGSASKAQNVNAALAHVRGHFVGLFDADHHPAPGSFQRAWQWIDDGAGVVQGHCVIRNGELNAVTRTVAVEFESIYAVSHPGRARVHGFGIFGGSNGYWRTSLLHRTRMRGSMLTEDIDSSMRVVESGETIISDPDLVSTELAPETWGALWNQRLRWAQGWSQVSIRHLVKMMRAAPTLRQRAGVFYLLGWREIYPWISLQMFPLLAYWWLRGESHTDWFVPIFVATTVFTVSVGPAQTWFAYRLAHPSIKAQRRWFLQFLLVSTVFYTEFKNVVGRTAQIKEAMRERKWKVTPRTGSTGIDTGAAPEELVVPESTDDPVVALGDADHDPAGEPAVDSAPQLARAGRPEHGSHDHDHDHDRVLADPADRGDRAVRRPAHGGRAARRPPVARKEPLGRTRRHGAPGGGDARARDRGGRRTAVHDRTPGIYDVEREPDVADAAPVHLPEHELRIYDVEREAALDGVGVGTSGSDPSRAGATYGAIDDVGPEPAADTSLIETPTVRRPRPEDVTTADETREARPAAAIMVHPTAIDPRRPMIAGVEGSLISPKRRGEPGAPADTPPWRPHDAVGPLLGDVTSPGVLRGDGDGDLGVGQPVDLEALRPRHRAADESNLSGT